MSSSPSLEEESTTFPGGGSTSLSSIILISAICWENLQQNDTTQMDAHQMIVLVLSDLFLVTVHHLLPRKRCLPRPSVVAGHHCRQTCCFLVFVVDELTNRSKRNTNGRRAKNHHSLTVKQPHSSQTNSTMAATPSPVKLGICCGWNDKQIKVQH